MTDFHNLGPQEEGWERQRYGQLRKTHTPVATFQSGRISEVRDFSLTGR